MKLLEADGRKFVRLDHDADFCGGGDTRRSYDNCRFAAALAGDDAFGADLGNGVVIRLEFDRAGDVALDAVRVVRNDQQLARGILTGMSTLNCTGNTRMETIVAARFPG